MKKVLINIVLLLGLVLFVQSAFAEDLNSTVANNSIEYEIDANISKDDNISKDVVIVDTNTTSEDLNITIEDDNITTETNTTSEDLNITIEDDNITTETNTTSEDLNITIEDENKTIAQILPVISYVNIDAVDDQLLLEGNATKDLQINIVLIHNSNERITVDTTVDEDGHWILSKTLISQRLEDGKYDIFVSTRDEQDTKSEVASIKDLVRDKTINCSIEIHDGSSKALSDDIINIKEMDTFYINGKVDPNDKIEELYLYNEKNDQDKIIISPTDIIIDNNGSFKLANNIIILDRLLDGTIIVSAKAIDDHNNTTIVKAKIQKDTIAPNQPIILQKVKNDNLIYGKVSNILVFSGSAEVDSKIEATLFNIDYPKYKTMGVTKTPESTKWVLSGRDFVIKDLKDGMIKITIFQIDKAGNRSTPLELLLKKERPLIFPNKVVQIPPENYMPIFTIKDITDKVKSIVVGKDYIIAGSFEFIYYFDKQQAKLQKQIEIKDRWINSMLIYEDKLILALDNGDIQIRDLDTSRLLKTLKFHKMPILNLVVDKSTNYLISSSSDGDIVISDINDYKKLYVLKKHQWDVASIVTNNNILYTGSEDYSIKMWNIKDGKLIKNLKSAHGGAINSLVVYKDMLISASDDNFIFVRDIKTGKLLHKLIGHKRGVTKLKINHNILVSASKDRTLILWDLNTFKKIKQLRGHSKTILSLDINDENIVTGSMDYRVRVWGYDESLQGQGDIDETTLAKFDLIRSLNVSNDTITGLAQTESEIVFSTKGYIFFYNNVTYKFSRSYTTLDKVFAEQTKKKDAKDQESDDSSDDEWADEEDEEDVKKNSDEESKDDGWADDSSDSDEDDKPGWEEELNKKKELRDQEAKANLQWINDIDIQGTVLTAALGYKNIKIWDLEKNKAVALLEGHESSVLNIARTDGSFVTSSSDGSIKIWDEETNALAMSIDAHQWDIKAIVVDDGKIYSGSDDYSIKIWDMETGDLIKTIKNAHNGNITDLLIYNNTLISSSSDGTIIYRDKNSGKLIKTLKGHTKSVNKMVMDDRYLISGSDDATIKVWDLKTGELIRTLNNGHTDGITSLMLTDDYIISGGKDKKISIWKYYE